MDRITSHRYAELITAGLHVVPPAIRRLVAHAHIFTVDPVFAGISKYDITADGRSYRDTWHVLYPRHQLLVRCDRRTTIVMPTFKCDDGTSKGVASVIHELGHVLDEVCDFKHQACAVSSHAETNRREAFAESFAAWMLPGYLPWGIDDLLADKRTIALFEHLKNNGAVPDWI